MSWPAARHPAMLDAKARSASASRPRSHSATARFHRVTDSSMPLAVAELGQGPRGERGRALGVAAELGEIAAMERDQRGDVHQQAAGPADGRLERLLGRAARTRARPRRAAAPSPPRRPRWRCHVRLGQQQPGPGPDQVVGQRRQPPLDRRRLRRADCRPRRSAARSAGRPRSVSPAATAWRIASSASPCSSYQAAALRCSCAARPGCSLCSRARSRSANRWW